MKLRLATLSEDPFSDEEEVAASHFIRVLRVVHIMSVVMDRRNCLYACIVAMGLLDADNVSVEQKSPKHTLLLLSNRGIRTQEGARIPRNSPNRLIPPASEL